MKYQFQIDNRSAGRIRDEWVDAAQDAVGAGYATWKGRESVYLDDSQGASIARIPDSFADMGRGSIKKSHRAEGNNFID